MKNQPLREKATFLGSQLVIHHLAPAKNPAKILCFPVVFTRIYKTKLLLEERLMILKQTKIRIMKRSAITAPIMQSKIIYHPE